MGFNSGFKGLRSSNSFLRLLPCLPVTSIPPCIFPSVTRCRRQFLRKMWLIQLAFRLRISCRIFRCSLTLSNHFSHDQSNWSFPSFSSTTLGHAKRLMSWGGLYTLESWRMVQWKLWQIWEITLKKRRFRSYEHALLMSVENTHFHVLPRIKMIFATPVGPCMAS